MNVLQQIPKVENMDATIRQPAASVVPFPGPRPRPGVMMRTEADQQLLLDTVINNMSQGVLMFDAEARLVFCNQRYIDMYGLAPEVVTPGCALRDLVEHRAAVGAFAGSPADLTMPWDGLPPATSSSRSAM